MTKVRINYQYVCKKCVQFDKETHICRKHLIPTRGDDWGCDDFYPKTLDF